MRPEKITPQELADRYHGYIAQWPEGSWCISDRKPTLSDDTWAHLELLTHLSTNLFNIQWNGNWKDSLHSPRPDYKENDLVLVWAAGDRHANVLRFACWLGDKIRTFSVVTPKLLTWDHYCPFDEALAKIPIADWPTE